MPNFRKKMPQKNKGVKKRLSQLERKVTENRPEVKLGDIIVDVPSIATAGHTDYVVSTGSGPLANERIGNEIRVLGVRWKGRLRKDSLDLVSTTSVRLLLFYDLEAKPGVKPTILELLESAEVHSFSKKANRARFNILYDKIYTMEKDTRTGIPFDTKLLKYKYKQSYVDSSANNYVGRTLFWAVISTAATAGELPSLDSDIRTFYVDP